MRQEMVLLHCIEPPLLVRKKERKKELEVTILFFIGSLETCIVLIQHGADLNAKDSSFRDYKTPLEKARAYNKEEVVEYLKQF